MRTRLRHPARAVLPADASKPAGAPITMFDFYDAYRPELGDAHRRLMAFSVRTTSLDPVVKELVRLRCGRYHDCRLCQTIRWAVAPDEFLPESVNELVDDYERSDLDERQKVALRLADGYLGAPGEIDATLRAQVCECFDPVEVVELVLCIMKWSSQKLGVALRVDDPAAAHEMMHSSVATGAQGRTVALEELSPE